MTCVGEGRFATFWRIVSDGLAVVEEEDPLVPRNRDHDAEAIFLGEIEEPARRRVVDPEHVDAEFAHQAEIDRDFLRRGQIDPAFGRGPERAVGHALEIKLVLSLKEKFRPHLQAGEINRGDGHRGKQHRARCGVSPRRAPSGKSGMNRTT